jgi:hypothetical protein
MLSVCLARIVHVILRVCPAVVVLPTIGEGIDIGKAAMFLLLMITSFVAGVELFVDGGINAV